MRIRITQALLSIYRRPAVEDIVFVAPLERRNDDVNTKKSGPISSSTPSMWSLYASKNRTQCHTESHMSEKASAGIQVTQWVKMERSEMKARTTGPSFRTDGLFNSTSEGMALGLRFA